MAAARPDTWMPLYIGDYLADTMHLSHAQHGIYMLLIMAYWRNGGPLPDDASQLAAIAKCSPQEWRKHLPVVARFFNIDAGIWAHKRIDAELEGATIKTQERSKAGAEGARKRWQKDGKAIAEPLANLSQNDAPLPSPRKKDSDASASGAEAPDHDPVKELWDRGVKILGQSSRGLIGKARKQYGDIAVLQAIADCELEGPTEPAGFFVKCLQQGQRNERKQQSGYDTLARAAIEHDERQGNRGHPEAAYRPSRDTEELDDFGGIVH